MGFIGSNTRTGNEISDLLGLTEKQPTGNQIWDLLGLTHKQVMKYRIYWVSHRHR